MLRLIRKEGLSRLANLIVGDGSFVENIDPVNARVCLRGPADLASADQFFKLPFSYGFHQALHRAREALRQGIRLRIDRCRDPTLSARLFRRCYVHSKTW